MAEAHKPDDGTIYPFKVNGIQFDNKDQMLLASEILKRAAEQGAMPGKPDEYVLHGEKRQYAADDEVNLAEDNIFITIPNKSTPVA